MQRLTVQEAAARLGTSADTVRRRVKTGELRGEKELRPQGYTYVVLFDDDEVLPDPLPLRVAGDANTELRHLQELLSEARGERDYLRAQLAAVTVQNQHLISRLALPAGSWHEDVAATSQPARRWTALWPWRKATG